MERTTLGGYCAAIGTALAAGAQALAGSPFVTTHLVLTVAGAILATFGMALLGHAASDASKTIQSSDVAKLPPHEPITPRDLIEPDAK
jgi:multisubunit Na+/H+ antiporter MnhG subunit